MKKKKIVYHGNLHDYIDYGALIEAQGNTPTFLEEPKEYLPKINNKKLVLSYKKVVPRNKNNI